MYIPEKRLIQEYLNNKSHPKAGIVLLTADNEILILKGKPGKWTFPKGSEEFKCKNCGILLKNPLDYTGECPYYNLEKCHKVIAETILECAKREFIEETGINIPLSSQILHYCLVKGKKEYDEGCVYIIMKCQESKFDFKVKIDSKEILEYQWISIRLLTKLIKVEYYDYNMGVRKMMPYLTLINLFFQPKPRIINVKKMGNENKNEKVLKPSIKTTLFFENKKHNLLKTT